MYYIRLLPIKSILQHITTYTVKRKYILVRNVNKNQSTIDLIDYAGFVYVWPRACNAPAHA